MIAAMPYDTRLGWLTRRLCSKSHGVLTLGEELGQICANEEPTKEMVQLGTNWDIDFYGNKEDGWIVDIYEKSTEREFTIYINMAR